MSVICKPSTTEPDYENLTKEQLIEMIEEGHYQVLKHKGKYFFIYYWDQDYSSGEMNGSQHSVGQKVYCSRWRNDPRTFIGTAVDMTTLTKEQLLEAINAGW